MSQEDKSYLNLAGEFLVAGELNRRKVAASITYGASKSADIFAFCRKRKKFARIEVKATDKKRWPVGQRALSSENEAPDVFWVLVNLPTDHSNPDYFVFTGKELTDLSRKLHFGYLAQYKAKHGVDYASPGVPAINIGWIPPEHRNNWKVIIDYLE
jgi:hypothetical protein